MARQSNPNKLQQVFDKIVQGLASQGIQQSRVVPDQTSGILPPPGAVVPLVATPVCRMLLYT